MAKSTAIESPLLIAVAKPAHPIKAKKATKRAAPTMPPAAEYKPPSHDDMKRSAAQRAHRDVVESWVKGEASDRKVAQSKSRMQRVMKGRA